MTTFPNWSVTRQDAVSPLMDSWIATLNLPPSVVYGLVALESGFNPTAYRAEPQINDASYGLTQILLATARGLGYQGDGPGLYDPNVNLQLGLSYFADLLTRYGDTTQALSAYNTGRPTGSTAGQTYAAAVLARAEYFDSLWTATMAPDTQSFAPSGDTSGNSPVVDTGGIIGPLPIVGAVAVVAGLLYLLLHGRGR